MRIFESMVRWFSTAWLVMFGIMVSIKRSEAMEALNSWLPSPWNYIFLAFTGIIAFACLWLWVARMKETKPREIPDAIRAENNPQKPKGMTMMVIGKGGKAKRIQFFGNVGFD